MSRGRGRPKGTIIKTHHVLASVWAYVEYKRTKNTRLSIRAICQQWAAKAANENQPPFYARKIIEAGDGQRDWKTHEWKAEPETLRQLYKDAKQQMKTSPLLRRKAENMLSLYHERDSGYSDFFSFLREVDETDQDGTE